MGVGVVAVVEIGIVLAIMSRVVGGGSGVVAGIVGGCGGMVNFVHIEESVVASGVRRMVLVLVVIIDCSWCWWWLWWRFCCWCCCCW